MWGRTAGAGEAFRPRQPDIRPCPGPVRNLCKHNFFPDQSFSGTGSVGTVFQENLEMVFLL